MVFYGMRLLLIVAGLFHIALAVTYTCDPFYNSIQERQKTCLSSNIGHNASSDYLTIYSTFSGCENNNETESISTFFSDRFNPWTVQIDPGYEFYFEYTIMWTSTDSNCVVDLTPTSPSTNSSNPAVPWAMVDQNGISNNPLENLTDLALNKPYTRRFILSPGSPASYRFGFTCARQNGENSTNAEQTAVVSGIMYGMTAELAHWNTPVYYPPWGGFGCTTNTSCPDPAPHEDAICAIVRPWGDSMWFYNGNYYAGACKLSPGVSGDLYLDEVLFVDSLIKGCFYPWHQSTITLVLYPDWMIRIRFGQQCNLPPMTIVGRPRTSEMQQLPGLSPNCNYTLNVEKVQIEFESTNYINYYAPLSAWDISCPNINSPSSNTDGNDNGTYSDNGTLWALVFGIVGGVILIGVIIGIIFGVRKYKQRHQKKDKKKADETEEKQSERR